MEEISYVFSFPFFFIAAHFHLALVAASFSYFVTAVSKLSLFFQQKKKMPPSFFLSRSRSLSPFFSLSFAGLQPDFLFFSILNLSPTLYSKFVDMLDHESKLNTLDNTDTETISAFRFRLY